jgi:hypothetical protein
MYTPGAKAAKFESPGDLPSKNGRGWKEKEIRPKAAVLRGEAAVVLFRAKRETSFFKVHIKHQKHRA